MAREAFSQSAKDGLRPQSRYPHEILDHTRNGRDGRRDPPSSVRPAPRRVRPPDHRAVSPAIPGLTPHCGLHSSGKNRLAEGPGHGSRFHQGPVLPRRAAPTSPSERIPSPPPVCRPGRRTSSLFLSRICDVKQKNVLFIGILEETKETETPQCGIGG